MKVFLMHKDKDFEPSDTLPFGSNTLVSDLELDTIFQTMSNEDEYIYDISKKTFLNSLKTKDEIIYRQNILKDCLNNRQIVLDIYNLTIKSIEKKHENLLGIFGRFPGSLLSSSVSLLEMYFEILKELREIANLHSKDFNSSGFKRFFKMIQEELDDEYLKIVKEHLKELRFKKGILISAKLGRANEGINYTLRRDERALKGWLGKVFAKKGKEYSYTLHPRDDAGATILRNIRDEALYNVAISLSASAKHVDNLLKNLRKELAFYIGCMNIERKLKNLGCEIAFPKIKTEKNFSFFAKDLYDVSLSLLLEDKPTGNDIDANEKKLIMITGANQGGKSTFLRSIGLSFLMMQCGMFAGASSFSSSLCSGIFTHFKKEEDKSLESGKFDEELLRMSQIIEHISKNALILLNESFASTNEAEGSQIAIQIVKALLEKDIRIIFVTHMFELSNYFYNEKKKEYLFLRANRDKSGKRDFKIIKAPPLKTSYAKDIYKKIFMIK